MKIIDGLSLPGWRVEIPDCGRDDLPAFFKDMGFKQGAEIGVRRGEFTEMLCQEGLRVFAIDPWRAYDDYTEPETQKQLEMFCQETRRRLSPYDCQIIRKTSMEAAQACPDESLDFVYIDGNHAFRYVAEDLVEWSKKVRRGGVVSGHDYRAVVQRPGRRRWDMHTKYVVDAYMKAYAIPKWYVLGSKVGVEGEKRDRWRSWFLVKP